MIRNRKKKKTNKDNYEREQESESRSRAAKIELIAGLTVFSLLESSLTERAVEWKVFKRGS